MLQRSPTFIASTTQIHALWRTLRGPSPRQKKCGPLLIPTCCTRARRNPWRGTKYMLARCFMKFSATQRIRRCTHYKALSFSCTASNTCAVFTTCGHQSHCLDTREFFGSRPQPSPSRRAPLQNDVIQQVQHHQNSQRIVSGCDRCANRHVSAGCIDGGTAHVCPSC